MSAIINGNRQKVKGLAQNAASKFRLNSSMNMVVIPQPGHLKPVQNLIGHGIPIPVKDTNKKYKSPHSNTAMRAIVNFCNRLFLLFCNNFINSVLH